MLESLYIKNYRLFKELKINSLKRVNLIVGKNNVGKSSLLESLWLFLNQASLSSIETIFRQRGELIRLFNNNSVENQELVNNFKNLFYGRKLGLKIEDSIKFSIAENHSKSVDLFFGSGQLSLFGELPEDYFLNLGLNGEIQQIPLSKLLRRNIFFERKNIPKLQLLNSKNIQDNSLSILWSEIALSDKEQYVIKGLQLIEPSIDKISFIDEYENSRYRKAVIKLKNLDERISLKNMGDGINHILAIILHLINCENGYFLIDEFETGLHWSVQADLWRVIFHLAEKLNIQVFATTHSRDTIRALEEVAQTENQEANTQFIKLVNKNGNIHAIEYDFENVAIAIEDNLEIR